MIALMSSAPKYWAVVPAAGSGSRMQSDVPKQYLNVLDKRIIEHTLSLFISSKRVQQVVVCLPNSDHIFKALTVAESTKVSVTEGGDSRAQSVLNGLIALKALNANDNDWVLVHDAARPCFTNYQLNHLIDELADDDIGGIMAVRAKDTLKLSDTANRIKETVDRSIIWQAQTPQMFRFGLLKKSLSTAIRQKATITDEASALEWAGYQPKLIEGDARNIKVTTPEDLALVEFLLERNLRTKQT